jgi:hypothetical protein
MRVVALTDLSAVIVYDAVGESSYVRAGRELLWALEGVENLWKEYISPRSTIPKWYNVFENASEPTKIWLSQTPHGSKEGAKEYAKLYVGGCKLIDTIEITYTEKK